MEFAPGYSSQWFVGSLIAQGYPLYFTSMESILSLFGSKSAIIIQLASQFASLVSSTYKLLYGTSPSYLVVIFAYSFHFGAKYGKRRYLPTLLPYISSTTR